MSGVRSHKNRAARRGRHGYMGAHHLGERTQSCGISEEQGWRQQQGWDSPVSIRKTRRNGSGLQPIQSTSQGPGTGLCATWLRQGLRAWVQPCSGAMGRGAVGPREGGSGQLMSLHALEPGDVSHTLTGDTSAQSNLVTHPRVKTAGQTSIFVFY